MANTKDTVNTLLDGKEIEPTGLYDFSFRKVPEEKVPLFRGLKGQLTVNPDDKYRLQAWYGDELGHHEKEVLQSDFESPKYYAAFKNTSAAYLDDTITDSNYSLDPNEIGAYFLHIKGNNTLSINTPNTVGTSVRVFIENLAEGASISFGSDVSITWASAEPTFPTELARNYCIELTWDGSKWIGEQNTSNFNAAKAEAADYAELTKKFASLYINVNGWATGSGSALNTDTVSINITDFDASQLFINSELPKVPNTSRIYADISNRHFWVYNNDTAKWYDCFEQLETELDNHELRITDLEKLDLSNRVTTLETRADTNDTTNADFEKRISTNASDIDNLETRVTTNETNIKTNTDNISALDTRVTTTEANVTKLDQRVGNIETSTDVGQLAAKITDIEDKNTEQDTSIKANSDAIKANSDAIKANSDAITALNTSVTTQLKNQNTSIEEKISEFNTSITNQINQQNTDVSDKLATVVTLTGDQTITGNKLFENTSSSVTTATADVVIDNTSPDNIILPKLTTATDATDGTETATLTSYSITVNNGTTNTAWTKCIKLEDSASTISFGDAWSWVGGDAPELVNNCLLVAKWCGDFGLANVISAEG